MGWLQILMRLGRAGGEPTRRRSKWRSPLSHLASISISFIIYSLIFHVHLILRSSRKACSKPIFMMAGKNNHNRKPIILKAGHAIMAMNVQRFIEDAIEEIKRDVKGRAIIGLSGGVDSSVCAMLAHRAIGDRLVPVYVDSGLMRQFESDRIEQLFQGHRPGARECSRPVPRCLERGHGPGREEDDRRRDLHPCL